MPDLIREKPGSLGSAKVPAEQMANRFHSPFSTGTRPADIPTTSTTHSSTVRTLQEIFHVGPFLNDATNATDLSDLFALFEIAEIKKLTNGDVGLSVSGTFIGATILIQTSTNLFD